MFSNVGWGEILLILIVGLVLIAWCYGQARQATHLLYDVRR